MFQIFALLLVILSFSYIADLSLTQKVIFILATVSVGALTDKLIIKKIPFFRIFTVGILLTLGSFLLAMIAIIFDVQISLAKETPIIENILLAALLIAFYLSVRIGANADYFKRKTSNKETKTIEKCLIDTCIIIDGRILEIAQSGFIPRALIIPQFVIQELQLISDSHSHEKRTKGRRGLELLKQMKNSDHLSVQIITEDIPEEKNVDRKLLALAKRDNYKVITTDFNLVKVAQLENIPTLNINHLASLIKASLTVGERIRVYISKKGNNKNQGIAFMPDDTMVVVEEAEKFISQQKMVTITSYIQNESGRIAFAKLT